MLVVQPPADPDFRPPAPQPVTIQGPAGPLEARVDDPVPAGGLATAVGVVCHPHPLYGGTMGNKVVHTLARAMQEAGAPTVRFNFRGVGESGGVHADGSARSTMRSRRSSGPGVAGVAMRSGSAGFSFGSAVALQAAITARPQRW